MEYHCKYDELVDPSVLIDNPRNPNQHPKCQVDALVSFIRFSGWRHPVIVSRRSGQIVCGHARKLAALQLGEKVPVVYQDFEKASDEQALLLADNHIQELAETDNYLEALQVSELAELDIPVLDFGFELADNKSHQIEHFESKPYAYIDIIMRAKIEDVKAETLEAVSSFASEHGLEVLYAGHD